MTDSESGKERRNQVARYRVMAQETTDPLAACPLHDIILDGSGKNRPRSPNSNWPEPGGYSSEKS